MYSDLNMKVAVAHGRSRPYMYGVVYEPVLNLERLQNSKVATTSGYFPPSWIFGRRCRRARTCLNDDENAVKSY